MLGTMPNGEVVKAYLLANSKGASAEILNVGATVRSLAVPDKDGHLADVVLGCDTVADYLESPLFDAIAGRYGNRINRIRHLFYTTWSALIGKSFTESIIRLRK